MEIGGFYCVGLWCLIYIWTEADWQKYILCLSATCLSTLPGVTLQEHIFFICFYMISVHTFHNNIYNQCDAGFHLTAYMIFFMDKHYESSVLGSEFLRPVRRYYYRPGNSLATGHWEVLKVIDALCVCWIHKEQTVGLWRGSFHYSAHASKQTHKWAQAGIYAVALRKSQTQLKYRWRETIEKKKNKQASAI